MVLAAGAWLRIRSLQEKVAEVHPATRGTGTTTAMPSQAAQSDAAIASGEISAAGAAKAAAAERERRYRQLLESPPPPPPRAAAPPSTIDRVLGPLVEKLGAERAPSVAAPVAAPPTTPATTRSPARTRKPIAKTRVSTAPATATGSDQDPETDIQPPQLIAADFLPKEVMDGEETVFTATIVDDLSGVRSASGVIASPSGSVHMFSAVSAGADLFVARVNVPRDAPVGVWTVRDLVLTDNAANSTRLRRRRGAIPSTADFRVVSSSPDQSGPELKSVWLDRASMRGGERNTVFVQADDDKAGVAEISGLFVSPGQVARIRFECRTEKGGIWHCPFAAPPCVDCGAWRLEQVRLHDKAGNRTTVRIEHPAVSNVALHVASDRCDNTAPIITTLSVNPLVVSNARANTIEIRAIVEDQGACGVASVIGEAVPPRGLGGQRHPLTFKPLGDGMTYIATLALPQSAVRGQWAIPWINVIDRGNNLRTYSGTDPVIARGTFQVE